MLEDTEEEERVVEEEGAVEQDEEDDDDEDEDGDCPGNFCCGEWSIGDLSCRGNVGMGVVE